MEEGRGWERLQSCREAGVHAATGAVALQPDWRRCDSRWRAERRRIEWDAGTARALEDAGFYPTDRHADRFRPRPPPRGCDRAARRTRRGWCGWWFICTSRCGCSRGALRKWIVPGLANPLLVVRDPVLIGLYVLAYAKGVFPRSAFLPWIAGLGVIATFVSLAATDAPMVVTIYGLRCDYLHLPLIFLLPAVLRREDLRLIGKCWLALAAGMAVLVLLQFRSSAGSFWNRGRGARGP